MDQPTFADLEYESKKRKTRREIFLERMDGLIPWEQLAERIRPFYPRAGRGRRPYELSVMLRIHCVQMFYNLRWCFQSVRLALDLTYETQTIPQRPYRPRVGHSASLTPASQAWRTATHSRYT